ECFYYRARRGIQGAQILVVNHALFFSDLALRRVGAGFLPDYKVVVFDEAHTLEDVAADHLGLQVTQGGLEYLFNRLLHPTKHRGLLASYGDDEAIAQLEHARQATERFFLSVRTWKDQQARGTGRVREPGIVPDTLSEELNKLASNMSRCAEALPSDEEKVELTSAAARCSGLATAVAEWLSQGLDGQVYWVETRGERQNRMVLASAPVEVGPALREHLYSKGAPIIMTSAT